MNWQPASLITLTVLAAACSQPVVEQKLATSPELVSERLLVSEGWDDFKWSPDGKRLLLSRWEYQETGDAQPRRLDAPVAIAEAENGEVQVIPQAGYAPIWSPDGGAVLLHSAAGDKGEELYWLYSIESGQHYELAAVAGTSIWLWLEGGLYFQDDAGLQRVRIQGLPEKGTDNGPLRFTAPELLLAFDGSSFDRWASPSPDGKTLMLIDHHNLANRRWWLVQPDGVQVEMVYPLYSLGTCCAWSKDSQRLAYFGLAPDQGLYIVDSDGNHLKRLVSADQLGEGAFLALDFSPDGRWIAFTWTEAGEGFPFEQSQIYLVGVEGQGLRQLTVDGSHPHNWLSWSPDGRYIASKGEYRDIWLAELRLP